MASSGGVARSSVCHEPRSYTSTRVTSFFSARWVAYVAVGAVLAGGACRDSPSPAAQVQTHLDRALRAHSAGQLDAARREYDEVLKADARNQYALYNLGLIAQTQGDAATAEQHYRKALEVDPKMVPALFNLAIVRTHAGAAQEAVSLYRQVLAIDPNNAGADLNLGLLLVQLGQGDEGNGLIATAVQLDPSLASRLTTQGPSGVSG